MADFCKKCSEDTFGEDFGDLANLCKPGEVVAALCEGCDHGGNCAVDHEGKCQGSVKDFFAKGKPPAP